MLKLSDEMECTPMFFSYQLIGDSMLLRFAEQILGLRCKYENGLRYLGFCVSGQTLKDLRIRLKQQFYHVSDKVILLIGTNDMLRDTKPARMQTRMKSILKYIRETASEVVVLTVPPVPKLAFRDDHWSRLQAFNSYILTLNDGVTIRVADITSLYLAGPRLCRMDYFEKRGLSLIHAPGWNHHTDLSALAENCTLRYHTLCKSVIVFDKEGLRHEEAKRQEWKICQAQPLYLPDWLENATYTDERTRWNTDERMRWDRDEGTRFYESNRRVDKIHLNKKGLTVIRDFLLNNNFVLIVNVVPEDWVSGSETWISGS